MSGYNYPGRGGGYTDDRNKTSYGENSNSDHVCRPVIIDAEGRKRPIISYLPPNHGSESYVTSTERIVEHVRTPVVVTEYNYTIQGKVEPLKDYGATNDRWPNPSNQIYDRPEYRYNSQPNVEPVRTYGERPQKVEDFLTKVQTEVSRPTRGPLLNATHWRNPQGGTNGYGNTNGYGGEYANHNNSNWNKQNGNHFIRDESLAEPIMTKDGRWERPAHKVWSTPLSPTTPLSGPTNDIGKAVETLKEAVNNPSSIAAAALQSRFSVPGSGVPKKDTYAETIDSREAAKRYGKFNVVSSRGNQTGEATIDSREAERIYNGKRV